MAYTVCPDCQGEGSHDTLGAYTSDEFEQAFEDADEYFALAAIARDVCAFCQGQRVVTDERMAEWADEREYRAERAAEMRMGC